MQVLHELKCAQLKIVLAKRVTLAGPEPTSCAEVLLLYYSRVFFSFLTREPGDE